MGSLRDFLFYEELGVQLYCGDCRDLLPLLDPVDGFVTDPPFGIGWTRGTWDDSPEAYPALMRWLVAESRRVVPIGWCFVFQAMPNVARFHEWFPEGWRLFAACKNFVQMRPVGVQHSWDPVVFWRHGPNRLDSGPPVRRDYLSGMWPVCWERKRGIIHRRGPSIRCAIS